MCTEQCLYVILIEISSFNDGESWFIGHTWMLDREANARNSFLFMLDHDSVKLTLMMPSFSIPFLPIMRCLEDCLK